VYTLVWQYSGIGDIMAEKTTKKPYRLDRKSCYIGEPVSTSRTGLPAARDQDYLRNWGYNGGGFMYSGPPFSTINPEDGSLYIINWGSEMPRSWDRELAIGFVPWSTHTASDISWIQWNPDYTDTTPANYIRLQGKTNSVTATDTWYSQSGMEMIFTTGIDNNGTGVEVPIHYTPSATCAHVCGRIDYHNYILAACSVWNNPVSDYGTYQSTQKIVADSDVAVGTIIRGFDATDEYRTGTQPSLGHLLHYVGDELWGISGGDSIDSIDSATRRCMYQHGHPAGYWTDQTSYNNMYDEFEPFIRPRNIFQITPGSNVDVKIYPSVVVSGYGTIKIETTTDTTTYTAAYTNSTALGTPNLVQPGDFTGTLKAELGTDTDFTVSIKATSESEFLVHTVSLWEGPQAPD